MSRAWEYLKLKDLSLSIGVLKRSVICLNHLIRSSICLNVREKLISGWIFNSFSIVVSAFVAVTVRVSLSQLTVAPSASNIARSGTKVLPSIIVGGTSKDKVTSLIVTLTGAWTVFGNLKVQSLAV